MNVAEAADIWLETAPQVAEFQEKVRRRHDEAAKVLKEHFRDTGHATYRGKVGADRGTAYARLSESKARELLGPKAAAAEYLVEPLKLVDLRK